MKVRIGQEYDGFFIEISTDDGAVTSIYNFNQESTVEELVTVFNDLGIEDVTYEEVS